MAEKYTSCFSCSFFEAPNCRREGGDGVVSSAGHGEAQNGAKRRERRYRRLRVEAAHVTHPAHGAAVGKKSVEGV